LVIIARECNEKLAAREPRRCTRRLVTPAQARVEGRLWLAMAAVAVLLVAAAFYAPALERTWPWWPAPLDDVYIHFDFARSAAALRPFQWITGNGYSSGATSLTYPLLLAPAFWLGLEDRHVGAFAAALACLALIDLARSLRRLFGRSRTPRWVAWTVPALLLSVPLLDWSWFSGMETAVVGAVVGRVLAQARRAMDAPPTRRRSAQLAFGLGAAVLVATRPELVVLAGLLAVAVTYGARSLTTLGSLARGLGPTLGFLAVQAGANLLFTGELSAAGAVRKLLWTNPYATRLNVAADVARNLVILRSQAFDAALGGGAVAWVLPALGALAWLDRRARPLALALGLGAVAALLLVSLNATAPYQNLRYAAPSLILLLASAALGLGALARRGRVGQAAAGLATLLLVLGPRATWSRQRAHFAEASSNVADQQVALGAKLRAMTPPPRRVFVGDAGAIPFVSHLPALDGLGLGGYHALPFARASVHGVPAVLELIERLAPSERPDVLALYPSWWPGLAGEFGPRLDSVTLAHNVICGDREKVLYAADWSSLAPAGEQRPGAVDALDVADLVSEREHRYTMPAPEGGWAIGSKRLDARGRLRFDAGRIIPAGRAEAFTVRDDVERGPATLALRTDDELRGKIRVERERPRGTVVEEIELEVLPPHPSPSGPTWVEPRVPLSDVGGGDLVRVVAVSGAYRSFHVWLLRDASTTGAW
jgi:hypothetical protein